MSSAVLPSADASRGILTPSSDGSLNRLQKRSVTAKSPVSRHGESAAAVVTGAGAVTTSPAAAADSLAMDHLLKPAVALKPHPPRLHVQPRLLHPLMLLPREHLALSCLDLTDPRGGLPPGRLFDAHIKILDLENRMGSTPRVLVARSTADATLYAVERAEDGGSGSLYTACKLGSWNDVDALAAHATVVCHERIRPPQSAADSAADAASEAIITPKEHKDQKKKRVAIDAIQSLVRKKPRAQSLSAPTSDDNIKAEADTQPEAKTEPEPEPASQPPSDPVPAVASAPDTQMTAPIDAGLGVPDLDVDPQQAAANIFDNIRSHYFEALYKSKGSLAYFAKGPLSRARSAFHLDLESNLDIGDLIEFLTSLVLTTVQIDKKYRETIPDVISSMRQLVDSSDEARKKRRRSAKKKMKLGKNGLYTNEDDRVRQWWTANKPELGAGGTDDGDGGPTSISMEQVKAHTSLLRTRETHLQMIVIMEVLALEPLRPRDQPADGGGLPTLPGGETTDLALQPQPAPTPKKRNKHNLPVLLDVHADRLTIWQSTWSDEQILLQDSQVPSQPGNESQLQQKASSEPLRDFCVDVIVPFYSSRLPQLCDSLSRKLGGPVIVVSPPKPKVAKKSSSSHHRSSDRRDQRPGAAAKRTALHKRPQTLEHALSFEREHRRSVSRGPSQIEDLMRATSAAMPSIKREDSDLTARSSAVAPPSRGGDADSRRSSLSRSSSMTAIAGASDDPNKARRKAKIDAELRDAISNLRKPNRSVVGQAISAESERHRAMTGAKKLKRSGARPPAAPAIQVKATPANQRFRDVLGPGRPLESQGRTPPDAMLPRTDEIIPPSSVGGPLVPSTTRKRAHTDIFGGSGRGAIEASSPAAGGIVGQTPVKRSASSFLRRPVAEEPAIPPSSPIMSRTAGAASIASPTIPGSVMKPRAFRAAPPEEALFSLGEQVAPQTPVKAKKTFDLDTEQPQPQQQQQQQQKQPQQEKAGGGSIYAKLGWDDDDDLDDFL